MQDVVSMTRYTTELSMPFSLFRKKGCTCSLGKGFHWIGNLNSGLRCLIVGSTHRHHHIASEQRVLRPAHQSVPSPLPKKKKKKREKPA